MEELIFYAFFWYRRLHFLEGLGGTYGEQKITYGKRDFGKPFQDKTIYFRGGDKS